MKDRKNSLILNVVAIIGGTSILILLIALFVFIISLNYGFFPGQD